MGHRAIQGRKVKLKMRKQDVLEGSESEIFKMNWVLIQCGSGRCWESILYRWCELTHDSFHIVKPSWLEQKLTHFICSEKWGPCQITNFDQ